MRFKNVSGDERDIPALGRSVAAGEVFEASGPLAEGLLGQPAFQRTDTPARKAAARKAAASAADVTTSSTDETES